MSKMLDNLLSKETAGKLDTAISKRNIEQLKKHLEKLFTFKNIFTMHDDHIIELAENIIDLARAEDKAACAKEMKPYIQLCMSRYQRRRKEASDRVQWAKASKNTDKVEMLDLAYQLWVYTDGFEHSRFHMYSIIIHIINNIENSRKE